LEQKQKLQNQIRLMKNKGESSKTNLLLKKEGND